MVLDDVSDDSVCIKVPAPALSSGIFAEHNLHIANVVAMPERLEHEVRETQHGKILDQFLPCVDKTISISHTLNMSWKVTFAHRGSDQCDRFHPRSTRSIKPGLVLGCSPNHDRMASPR